MKPFVIFIFVIKISVVQVTKNVTTNRIETIDETSEQATKSPSLININHNYMMELNKTSQEQNEANSRIKHYHFDLLNDGQEGDRTTEMHTGYRPSKDIFNLFGIWKAGNHLDISKTNYLTEITPEPVSTEASTTSEMNEYIITWKPMPALKHKNKVVTKIQVKIKKTGKMLKDQLKTTAKPCKTSKIGTKTEHVPLGNVGPLTMWGDIHPTQAKYNEKIYTGPLEMWINQHALTPTKDHEYGNKIHKEDKIETSSEKSYLDDELEQTYVKDEYKEELSKELRVLCLVPTQPAHHYTRAIHVKNTWGKQCHRLLFLSTKRDSNLSTVVVPVQEGWNFLWGKTKAAFKYAYDHYFDEVDWILKADDDTFIVMDNLKRMLLNYKSEEPLYLGCKLKSYNDYDFPQSNIVSDENKESETMKSPTTEQIDTESSEYMSGSAYVLSKDALRRFVQRGLQNPDLCVNDDQGPEDIFMAKCMKKLNVKSIDLSNSHSHNKIIRNELIHTIPLYRQMWYFKRFYYPQKKGLECCSNFAITFTNLYPDDMYLADYLINHGKSNYGHENESDDIEEIPPNEMI